MPRSRARRKRDVGVAAAGPGEDGGAVVLEVAGAEEDVGDGGDVGGAVGDEAVEGVVDVGLGQLEEAGADPGGRADRGPDEGGELGELVGRGGVAAAVAERSR